MIPCRRSGSRGAALVLALLPKAADGSETHTVRQVGAAPRKTLQQRCGPCISGRPKEYLNQRDAKRRRQGARAGSGAGSCTALRPIQRLAGSAARRACCTTALGATKPLADQRRRAAIGFIIVALETNKGDPQHDLARAGGPAQTLFGGLEPFEKATAAQDHVT